MILSNEGIKRALQAGELEITPIPAEDQYTTSAVDLFLGTHFQGWNEAILDVQGAKVELNLARQDYQKTARAYLRSLDLERDGSLYLSPISGRS